MRSSNPYPKSMHTAITASPSVQAPPTLFNPFLLTTAGLQSCREQRSDGHTMPRKADPELPPFQSRRTTPQGGSWQTPGCSSSGSASAASLQKPVEHPPSPAPKDAPSHCLSPLTVTGGRNHHNHQYWALTPYLPIYLGLSSHLSNTQSSKTLCNHVLKTICNSIQVFL